MDVVLTEGKCSLPNPSSVDNYDGMQMWSPKPQSKKMPEIEKASPPEIYQKSGSMSASPGIS